MTEEQMTKGKIMAAIQSEWEALQTTLNQLSETQMLEPGVENGWTVKDILAHITDWEIRMVAWIEESLRGEVPQRPAPGMSWDDLDRLNQQTYLLHKDALLSEVSTDFHSSYQTALKTVESLTEQDLVDPQRFAWREGDPMWHMVAANTWWHYKEHNESIVEWLKDG